ncbi:MAG TPA: GNAT family N-acetyltransferase [Polyangiaceae bacterium]|nr:GNAT family N-acetyltransferase [Polyangiaceae bacterium]
MAQSCDRIQDSLRVHVFRDADGDCVGIVPLVHTQRDLGYLKVRVLSLLGADPNITEVRGPLIAAGEEARVVKALRACLAVEDSWDWIRWSYASGAVADALTRGAQIEAKEPTLDYVLDLAPSWDDFRKGLKRNIRESLRHCYNSLKREDIRFEMDVAESPEAVRRALDFFLPLHAMRASMTETVVHPNRFEHPALQRFLYDVCDRLAARGAVRVFQMKIGGAVVATRIGFIAGKSLYLYYSGFDPRWAKYGVSTTVVAEAIKVAIDLGLETVNLSIGTDVSKTRWGARPVEYHEAVETHPRVRSQIAYAAYRQLLSARSGWLEPLMRTLPKRGWR